MMNRITQKQRRYIFKLINELGYSNEDRKRIQGYYGIKSLSKCSMIKAQHFIHGLEDNVKMQKAYSCPKCGKLVYVKGLCVVCATANK